MTRAAESAVSANLAVLDEGLFRIGALPGLLEFVQEHPGDTWGLYALRVTLDKAKAAGVPPLLDEMLAAEMVLMSEDLHHDRGSTHP